MSEKMPSNFEKGSERIPTEKEVWELLENFIAGREYEETRKMEDEKGLYFWEIRITKRNNSGEVEEFIDYTYNRIGTRTAQDTAISVGFFDTNDNPTGGWSVANMVNGEWKIWGEK